MGSKISIKNYIRSVRSYLKKEENESSIVPEFEHAGLDTFTSPFTGMELIQIPAGKFEMGSPLEEKDRFDHESPVHKVTIKTPFYLGRAAVTQKQWKKVIGDNPSHFKGENLPVEMISWKDAQKFVEKLNAEEGTDKYRLPSEAEWEYACRAGTVTRYFFGNEESKLNEFAWYAENSGSKTHTICQKMPNHWGLYDMHGNVWEWVSDEFHENYANAPLDGSIWEHGNAIYRVSRGGSWFCNPGFCRSASRFKRDPESRIGNLGFRLLREL